MGEQNLGTKHQTITFSPHNDSESLKLMYFDYHEPLAKSRENNNKTSSLDDQEEGTEDGC